MSRFERFKSELDSLARRKSQKCKHSLDKLRCSTCSRLQDSFESDNSKRTVINRVRIFSPSKWKRNVKGTKRQADYKQLNIDNNAKWTEEIQQIKNFDSSVPLNEDEWNKMINIHLNLISKTSRLVEVVKMSRFGGFFSPRKLINRINLGNFSLIAWSPLINKRRALSPWSRLTPLNELKQADIISWPRSSWKAKISDIKNLRLKSTKKKMKISCSFKLNLKPNLNITTYDKNKANVIRNRLRIESKKFIV